MTFSVSLRAGCDGGREGGGSASTIAGWAAWRLARKAGSCSAASEGLRTCFSRKAIGKSLMMVSANACGQQRWRRSARRRIPRLLSHPGAPTPSLSSHQDVPSSHPSASWSAPLSHPSPSRAHWPPHSRPPAPSPNSNEACSPSRGSSSRGRASGTCRRACAAPRCGPLRRRTGSAAFSSALLRGRVAGRRRRRARRRDRSSVQSGPAKAKPTVSPT